MRIEQDIERKFPVAVIGDQRVTGHSGDEKLLQGGSNPVGEVKNCFGAVQISLGRADERCGKRQMRTSEMRTKVEGDKLATALLTIKYDNSPAERIVGPTKKAHLSASKPKGDSDNKCRLTTNNKDTTNKLVACSSRPRRTVGISAMLQRTVPFLPTSFNSLKGTVAEGSKEMRGKENNESCLPASNSRFEIKNKTEITNKLVARSSRLKI